MASVAEILEGKEICICAGSGGVGKTTTSAAIAAGAGGARQEGRGADDRPREAPRRLARPGRARQRARKVDPKLFDAGRGRDARRALGDDARRQGDLRRARPQSTRPTRRRATASSTTASTSRSPTPWPAPRSTWRWRSSSSSTRRGATTSSSSTRRPPATRSTSSTRPSG